MNINEIKQSMRNSRDKNTEKAIEKIEKSLKPARQMAIVIVG